jgi:tRNA (guanine-N7-)-methyltransferase
LTSSDAHSEPPRRYKHYGRLKGPKLSTLQAGLLESLLPRITVTPEAGSDPKLYFAPGTVRNVWLEIGFGAGEHLALQAERNPDTGLLGAEPYIAGVAKLLAKIAGRDLQNIRIYPGDAREIINVLPDGCLDRVFLLFPDPWPKARHHKRRFLSTDILYGMARVMRRGAELRFATDDRGHLVWALERLGAHAAFRWTAECRGDWQSRPADWPETRYENKAGLSGRVSTFLRFIRI